METMKSFNENQRTGKLLIFNDGVGTVANKPIWGSIRYSFWGVTSRLAIYVVPLFISGCAAFYVDRSERMISVDSTPQGAYVWDATGQKFLGQTPIQFQMKPDDYLVHRIFITKPEYYDETLQIYDQLDGIGLAFLDGLLVVPGIIDIITLTPFYGKYKGANFVVNLTSTSIPRPGAVVNQVNQQDAARVQAMVDAAQSTSQAITQGSNAFSAAMSQQQQANRPVVVSQPVVKPQPIQPKPVQQTTTFRPNTVKPYHREVRPPSFYVGTNPDGSMKVSDQSWRDRKK